MTLEIITDHKAMTITVGEKVFSKPELWPFPEKDTFLKQEICGPAPWDQGVKVAYQFLAAQLGPKFNRRFQAANYWLWVGRRMDPRTGNLLRMEGRHWRRYHNGLVEAANSALPYVNEAERDGLYHLIPAIVVFGFSPQTIRRLVGRGAWRRYARNSITRNKHIMHAATRMPTKNNNDLVGLFSRLLEVPSGVLRGIYGADEDEMVAARITPRKTPIEFQQTVHLVRDTRRMLGEQFNSAWGLHRMKEEHDGAARELHRQHYSDRRFADDWVYSRDGYSATLLTSALEIATEGSAQHHCVAGYATYAVKGRYAVFVIDGKERATAGLMVTGRTASVDQVYGACNSPVSPECSEFALRLASEYSASLRREAA